MFATTNIFTFTVKNETLRYCQSICLLFSLVSRPDQLLFKQNLEKLKRKYFFVDRFEHSLQEKTARAVADTG